MRTLGLALLATFAMAAPLTPGLHAQGAMAKNVDPAISKVSSAYEAANNAKDIAKLMALYMDDAVEMPPHEPSIRGRAAIEAYYKKQFAEADGTAKITPAESGVMGTMGYEVGTFAQSMKMKSGPAINDVGKYMVLLKQGPDKQWRVAYVIYNSDNPPMPMVIPPLPPGAGAPKKKP